MKKELYSIIHIAEPTHQYQHINQMSRRPDPLKVKTSTSSSTSTPLHHRHTSSLPSQSISAHQFHRRTASAVPVPKPSHKPPSTFHNFSGDIKSQDIFVDAIRTRNEKIRILFPGADRFEMQRNDIWNHDVICTPSLILQPKTEKEVSDCLKGYTAGVHKCLMANKRHKATFAVPRLCVAGGRNSFNCMREGSVVIDLCKMRSVKLDAETQTVKVGGGARIIDVDAVLGEYGLIAPLGTSQHLGVVGCILGGGLGFASRKYGMACDNVVAASVILADGRLKKCTHTDHKELLWSICGGGGGTGIVVSVTLKCYPLRHAALLTFDMQAIDIQQKRTTIRHWTNWINGDVGDDQVLVPNEPAPKEIFSQLIVPSNSNSISFLGSSIDTNAISQTDGFIELYSNAEKKSKKKGFRTLFGGSSGSVSDQSVPGSWQEIPGLADLVQDKFQVARKHVEFRLVRYADQLQSYSNEYFTPGNIYSSIKYAESITNQIIEILVQATTSEISPKNESKIVIMAMNGGIPDEKVARKTTAFSARDMHYMIYIEGKWDANPNPNKLEKEKKKVKMWVQWIVNKLHLCKNVRSGVHPESMMDMVSKSGKSKPPAGWYNFNEHSGRKMNIIKHQRDPRNVFSFASRVSWSRSLAGPVDLDNDDTTISTELHQAENVRDGEIQPTDCLTPQKKKLSDDAILGTASADDFDSEVDGGDGIDDSGHAPEQKTSAILATLSDNSQDGKDDSSVASDLMRLLSITDDDDDDDLKDWSLAPVLLQRSDFDSSKHAISSPHSVEREFDEDSF